MPGPYVQFATICDRVLREADGVLSIIRAVDRVIITADPEAPSELPEGRLTLTLVVSLKSDDARGRHPVTIQVHEPSGIAEEPKALEALFEGEERGVNLLVDFDLVAKEGLYWFDIGIHDRLLTRVPLRVIYQRIPGAR